MTTPSRFRRYVALGDSFTEGVGDPDPARPNGLRGWADRVAEVILGRSDHATYANLAIRGRKLDGIVAEQVEAAVTLEPDLITIYAGANDILRPHLGPAGHQRMAIEVLDTLGVPHGLRPLDLADAATPSRRERLRDDLAWARTSAAPWVQRRLTGRSSGDIVAARFPALGRIALEVAPTPASPGGH